MKKQYLLTKDGVTELQSELADLIADRGPVAERIKTAREFGDLAENAEYSSARLEQERAESRISEIENILQNITQKNTQINQMNSINIHLLIIYQLWIWT